MKTLTETQFNELLVEIRTDLCSVSPSYYYKRLWDEKLICSQGPWTVDHLIESGYFTKEAKSFVDHYELMEVFEDYYHEYIEEVIADMLIDDEDIKAIEDEDERYQTAADEAADDFNYPAWASLLMLLTYRASIKLDITI